MLRQLSRFYKYPLVLRNMLLIFQVFLLYQFSPLPKPYFFQRYIQGCSMSRSGLESSSFLVDLRYDTSYFSMFSLSFLPFQTSLISFITFLSGTSSRAKSLLRSLENSLKMQSSLSFLAAWPNCTLSITKDCPSVTLFFLDCALLLQKQDCVHENLTNISGNFFLRMSIFSLSIWQTMFLASADLLLVLQTSFLIISISLLSSMNFCRLQKRFLVRIWLRMTLKRSFSYSVSRSEWQLVSVSSPRRPSSRKLNSRVSYSLQSVLEGQKSFITTLSLKCDSESDCWDCWDRQDMWLSGMVMEEGWLMVGSDVSSESSMLSEGLGSSDTAGGFTSLNS